MNRGRLAENFEVEYWDRNERPPRPEVFEACCGQGCAHLLLTEKVDRELLDAAGPNLRIVANVAVGYDNIDVPACTERNVAVTNTPGVLDENDGRFHVDSPDGVARAWSKATAGPVGSLAAMDLDQLCGTDVWGKTLGIIGFGRIGRAVHGALRDSHARDL